MRAPPRYARYAADFTPVSAGFSLRRVCHYVTRDGALFALRRRYMRMRRHALCQQMARRAITPRCAPDFHAAAAAADAAYAAPLICRRYALPRRYRHACCEPLLATHRFALGMPRRFRRFRVFAAASPSSSPLFRVVLRCSADAAATSLRCADFIFRRLSSLISAVTPPGAACRHASFRQPPLSPRYRRLLSLRCYAPPLHFRCRAIAHAATPVCP